MILYYYEASCGHGRLRAKSDTEALKNMPSGTTILYKESDTPDGTPFIVIWVERKVTFVKKTEKGVACQNHT